MFYLMLLSEKPLFSLRKTINKQSLCKELLHSICHTFIKSDILTQKELLIVFIDLAKITFDIIYGSSN